MGCLPTHFFGDCCHWQFEFRFVFFALLVDMLGGALGAGREE